MPLKYAPPLGAVVLCDFHGLVEPEMVKVRDVVVVAKNKNNRMLVTVLPLSTTAPEKIEPYHHPLAVNPRPDPQPDDTTVWVKCDLVYTLSIERMSFHYKSSRRQGRVEARLTLPEADVVAIQRCLAIALNLPHN